MPKKIEDIKESDSSKRIDLRNKVSNKKTKKKIGENLVREKNIIFKEKKDFISVKDLEGGSPNKYVYIKGERHSPPKFLGNLLRVAAAGVAIVLVLNSLNAYYKGKSLEKNISKSAYEGYSFLVDAGKNATKIQFENAIGSFNMAQEHFKEAENSLWFVNTDQSFYAKNVNLVKSVDLLLKSGKHFAEAGEHFTNALEEFNKIPLYFISKNANEDRANPSITEALKIGLEKTNLAIEKVALAEEMINEVEVKSLPADVRAKVEFLKENVASFSETLKETSKHFPAILELLGDRYPHRYLILLQNNDEIRPTGGFIGSYIILDMNNGYIEKMDVHDVYDLDGSYGGKIEAPEIIQDFTKNLRLRDANYSPDFAVSAAKIKWIMQKQKGPGVDTVIAVNQSLLKDFLEITGPVQVGRFGKLNADNYRLLLSYVIEGKIWGDEDPKHILKVFVPAFKEAILKEEYIGKISSRIYRAIQQKDILMWSGYNDLQALFDATGLSGRTTPNIEKEDYLSVIVFSLGGTKSEKFIDEDISHSTNIDEFGNITNEVTIKRTHNFTEGIYREWRKTLNAYGIKNISESVIDILGRGQNRTKIRVYVPEGSTLIDATGAVETKYDIDIRKTYFYTGMDLKAGESKEITIKYKLPFKLSLNPVDTYKITVQKQAGSKGSIFTKTISGDEKVHNLGSYPSSTRIDEEGRIIYATNLLYDKYFSSVWGK
ncbi:MAG: DUF4012 domain-containing protein [Candidatus Gracilibacteria bacterium]|nr:DUF4012 domain-containing protein [Candidatus Gracilibacteria bacterium]